jgi:flagellar hook-basal body complex protein FliE
MNINAFNAIKTTAAQQSPLTAKNPQSSGGDGESFNPASMAKDMANAVANSERAASAYMVGKADPHSVVEAMASAELAVETVVTVRNRVVEAYQELLRMPI